MNEFYVYQLRIEGEELPFYIGKGKGKRARSHLSGREKVNQIKIRKINKARAAGKEILVEYVQENMEEDDAFNLEIELIKKYGRIDKKTGCLSNMTDGGEGVKNLTPEMIQKRKESIAKMRDDFTYWERCQVKPHDKFYLSTFKDCPELRTVQILCNEFYELWNKMGKRTYKNFCTSIEEPRNKVYSRMIDAFNAGWNPTVDSEFSEWSLTQDKNWAYSQLGEVANALLKEENLERIQDATKKGARITSQKNTKTFYESDFRNTNNIEAKRALQVCSAEIYEIWVELGRPSYKKFSKLMGVDDSFFFRSIYNTFIEEEWNPTTDERFLAWRETQNYEEAKKTIHMFLVLYFRHFT